MPAARHSPLATPSECQNQQGASPNGLPTGFSACLSPAATTATTTGPPACSCPLCSGRFTATAHAHGAAHTTGRAAAGTQQLSVNAHDAACISRCAAADTQQLSFGWHGAVHGWHNRHSRSHIRWPGIRRGMCIQQRCTQGSGSWAWVARAHAVTVCLCSWYLTWADWAASRSSSSARTSWSHAALRSAPCHCRWRAWSRHWAGQCSKGSRVC